MQTFGNIKFMIVDSKDRATYGSGGVRTYQSLKAAEQQFNGSDHYKNECYKIVKVGFKEVE